MTKTAFIFLCEQHAVAPAIALENENLREALANRDDAEVTRILSEDF